MIQKTIRFYDNATADMSALQILNNCKKYGFNNAREMIITAVNEYVLVQVSDSHSPALEEKDIDLLAEKIAMRIGNMTRNKDSDLKEEKYENSTGTNKNDESYQKALRFLDTL